MHVICQGMTNREVNIIGALNSKYECLSCQEVSLEEMKNSISECLTDISKNITKNDLDIQNLRLRKAELDGKLIASSGAISSAIYQKMKDLRISPEVFYGNIYTATTAMKWLEHHKEFRAVVKNSEVADTWNEIFELFRYG